MGELFENIQAGDDLVKHLEEEFHRELMEQAMVLVRPRVAPRTWDAFRLTALEGCIGRRGRRPARDEGRPGLRGQERGQGDDPAGGPQAGGDRMSHCPDRDRLERLLDHRLEDTELDEIEQHIEGCAACQHTLEELTGAAVCGLEPGRGTSITLIEAEPGLVVDPLG